MADTPKSRLAMSRVAKTRALAHGVSIAPGRLFSARPMQFANFIRLSCGMPWSPKIDQAVSMLGRLVKQFARLG